MAPRKVDLGSSERQGKIKFMFFELEGNDATLQDAIKSINGIINRATGGNGLGAPKRVNALPVRSAAEGANGAAQHEIDDPEVIETEALADETTTDESTAAARPRRKSGAPTKYPEPTLLDIDFNSYAVPLKQFVGKKDHGNHSNKFLVIAAWFRLHGDVEEVTADHIYSGYQGLEWMSRKNMVQPFYDLLEKNWVTKGDSGWRVTHIGLDKVKALVAAKGE